jgi:FkbM family methyltransferase
MSDDNLIQRTAQGWWVLKRDTHFSRWIEQAQRLDHDQPVLQKLAPYIEPGTTVLDIGAGLGTHTRFYLDRGGRVIAFEPHPLQFECLIRNCPQAYCYPYAVGETDDEAWLFVEPDMAGSSRLVEQASDGLITKVKRIRIDDDRLLTKSVSVSFMKIDVEGCEPEVLRGAKELIARDRPAIWMEVNPEALRQQKHSPDELAQVVAELGYRVKEFYPPGSDWNGCQGAQCDILCLPQ